MIRILGTLTAAMALAASPAFAEAPVANNADRTVLVEGNNQFAFDLYQQLAKAPGNKFFSPYSISTALGMTFGGARGTTADEMAKTLHFALPQARLHPAAGGLVNVLKAGPKSAFQLHTANSLWVQTGLTLRPEFQSLTESNYQAGLKQVDFARNTEGARKEINQWVEQKTNDKIKELIQQGVLMPDTPMVLTNAIYFKGTWANPFEKTATHPEEFYVDGGTGVKVPMMHERLQTGYAETPDFQLVNLQYKGYEVSMTVLLPKKRDGIADVERLLTPANLKDALGRMGSKKVDLSLPKFKMTESFELRKALEQLGMPTAFSDAADFTGLLNSSGRLKIGKVIHKAFVEVDEKGTEAAAATAVLIAPTSAPAQPEKPVVFKADHPFVFVIRHNATGSILFMGRVNDPR